MILELFIRATRKKSLAFGLTHSTQWIMDSAIRPLSEIGTSTCVSFSPGEVLKVQDFIRSSKKSTRSLRTPNGLEASQDDTLMRHQLTVQGFLHGLRRPVTPPSNPAEGSQAPNLQPIASTGQEDWLWIDSAATFSRPGLLDPPESIPSDVGSD